MESNWQPFETAPTDGTEIIVFHPVGGVFAAQLSYAYDSDCPLGELRWFALSGECLSGSLPTHWMPLPAYPDTISSACGDKDLLDFLENAENPVDLIYFDDGQIIDIGGSKVSLRESIRDAMNAARAADGIGEAGPA